ncbi:MAG: twin-arginine translocase TatA/TatE family subunit [Candidatus Eremiobacteraeota bacterium]|nr:twin-arginine translocase TatA/TatE family subunit [Candidatus Eremiobacteraeota bacterium]
MFNIGGSEMIVLAVLALLVFGPEGLPGIIKNVMRTVNAVKIAARDFQTEVSTALEAENERQDLAKRRRTYVDKPETESAALPAAEVAPMPEEEIDKPHGEIASAGEPDGEEAERENSTDVDTEGTVAVVDTETAGEAQVDYEPAEADGQEETEPVAAETLEEDEDDDDGPRVPMGRGRRVAKSEEKVAEPT